MNWLFWLSFCIFILLGFLNWYWIETFGNMNSFVCSNTWIDRFNWVFVFFLFEFSWFLLRNSEISYLGELGQAFWSAVLCEEESSQAFGYRWIKERPNIPPTGFHLQTLAFFLLGCCEFSGKILYPFLYYMWIISFILIKVLFIIWVLEKPHL